MSRTRWVWALPPAAITAFALYSSFTSGLAAWLPGAILITGVTWTVASVLSGGGPRGQTLLRIFLAGWLPIAAGVLVVLGAFGVGNWKGAQLTLTGLLGFAAWCGVAAMAILETTKRLLPVRSAFQRKLVASWLIQRTDNEVGLVAMGELVSALGLADRPASEEATTYTRQLGRIWAYRPWLARAGVDSVFNLPPEQLTAQIGQLVELPPESNSPQHPSLLLALSPGGHPETDISVAIDQLHVVLAGRWRHYLQGTTWWLSGAIGLMAVVTGLINSANSATQVVVALVLGGFFAWLARDLVAIVERLRR